MTLLAHKSILFSLLSGIPALVSKEDLKNTPTHTYIQTCGIGVPDGNVLWCVTWTFHSRPPSSELSHVEPVECAQCWWPFLPYCRIRNRKQNYSVEWLSGVVQKNEYFEQFLRIMFVRREPLTPIGVYWHVVWAKNALDSKMFFSIQIYPINSDFPSHDGQKTRRYVLHTSGQSAGSALHLVNRTLRVIDKNGRVLISSRLAKNSGSTDFSATTELPNFP